MHTETIIEDDRWTKVDLESLTHRVALAVLDHLGHTGDFEIVMLGCDDTRIAALNGDFRDKPTPTNVLSWPEWDLSSENAGDAPNPPEPGELGNIALAFDTCAREAIAQNKPFEAHVTHLIVHGVLHLLGYDHIQDKDSARMERLEIEILGKFGLPDPYTIEMAENAPDG